MKNTELTQEEDKLDWKSTVVLGSWANPEGATQLPVTGKHCPFKGLSAPEQRLLGGGSHFVF